MHRSRAHGHLPGSECSVAPKFPKEEFYFSGAHVIRKKKVKFRLTLNHSLTYEFSMKHFITMFKVASIVIGDYGISD
jgi:hypothetical protein